LVFRWRPGAIAPFADRINNTGSGEVSYQLTANRMIGGGGNWTQLDYPTPAQVPGLCNSNSFGGSAFYNLRLSGSQYTGGTYQYFHYVSCSVSNQSDTNTHEFNLYYTLYLNRELSMSFSGGPQHYDVAMSSLPSSASWTPSLMASMGWQSNRGSLSASYSRTVNGGGGLQGAFHSSAANLHARWQLTRAWVVAPMGSYESQKNVNGSFALSNPGGHMASGAIAVQRAIREHLIAEFGYQRQHQKYSSIAVISGLPDSNREYVSVTYQFERPLGR